MSVTEGWATRPGYLLSRWLFLRLLGVVYAVAFASLAVQVAGLVGSGGILPARDFLARAHALYGGAAYRLFPTLCWLDASDGMLRGLAWSGVALALLLVAGVAQVPVLLLETGLLAVLYAPGGWRPERSRTRAPSAAARWLVWWLVFRLMFLSGVTKLASGDPAWRRLTALDYHFWTEPLPPWTAWYANALPEWTHRAMTAGILAVELGAPWLIFVADRRNAARRAACALLVLGQLAIAATGNYGFFNLLAVVLCLSLLDDAALGRVLPLRLAAAGPEPRAKRVVIGALAPLLAVLSALAFAREIAQTLPGARGALDNPLLRAVAPLRSVNGYGLFRVMTTERPEIVIEESRDGVAWREYPFRWKPGDVTRRPPFVAPHQPRLDWQMWFAALDPEGARAWLVPSLARLLEESPAVLALLGPAPFPGGGSPPRYVRLAYWRYRFTTPEERARTGAWWHREFVGFLTRPLTARDLRGAR